MPAERPPATASPARQLARLMTEHDPAVVKVAQGALRKLDALIPGGVRLVYDNYNALVIAYGPSAKASEAVLSIALYPRWVTLFFLKGAFLTDPAGVLKGSGRQVRSVVLESAKDLDRREVKALVRAAIDQTRTFLPPRQMVVQAVSAKRRARRPVER
jgi:hypothetical protein